MAAVVTHLILLLRDRGMLYSLKLGAAIRSPIALRRAH